MSNKKVTFTSQQSYLEAMQTIASDFDTNIIMLETGLQNDHIPKAVKEGGLLDIFRYLIRSHDRYCNAGEPTLDTAELINDAICKAEDAKGKIQDEKNDMDNIDEYALDDIIAELEEHKENILEKQEVRDED